MNIVTSEFITVSDKSTRRANKINYALSNRLYKGIYNVLELVLLRHVYSSLYRTYRIRYENMKAVLACVNQTFCQHKPKPNNISLLILKEHRVDADLKQAR